MAVAMSALKVEDFSAEELVTQECVLPSLRSPFFPSLLSSHGGDEGIRGRNAFLKESFRRKFQCVPWMQMMPKPEFCNYLNKSSMKCSTKKYICI